MLGQDRPLRRSPVGLLWRTDRADCSPRAQPDAGRHAGVAHGPPYPGEGPPAALSRQKSIRSALLQRQDAQRRRQITAQLTAIEAELVALCMADADLKHRLSILESIPTSDGPTPWCC